MGWFIDFATSPAAPYILVAVVALAFAAIVLALRAWLDLQDSMALMDYRGHVPPHPIPRPQGMVPPRQWPASSNPVQRPLHTAQVPPAEERHGYGVFTPYVIAGEAAFKALQERRAKEAADANGECCGECDGSRCGDKPVLSASMMTPTQLREALSQRRSGQVPPRRNPQRQRDNQPYKGSYYGEAIDQILNGEAPGPTPAQSAALDLMVENAQELQLYSLPASIKGPNQ
jgi:hypothetical protein